MWDYDPPPHAQISICMSLVFFPYFDDILVHFMGMYRGRMGGMYVPHGMETLYVPYATCSGRVLGQPCFFHLSFGLLVGWTMYIS